MTSIWPGEFSGGRNFAVFSATGEVLFEPGAALELEAVRHGHYPDERSADRGIETEGVAVGVYDHHTFLFVGAERGNFVAVYRLDDESNPEFVQILPTGVAPEGLLPIPQRELFVSANEGDGTISIFQGSRTRYPPAIRRSSPMACRGARFPGWQQATAIPCMPCQTMCFRPVGFGRFGSDRWLG